MKLFIKLLFTSFFCIAVHTLQAQSTTKSAANAEQENTSFKRENYLHERNKSLNSRTKNISDNEQAKLNNLVDDLEIAAPNSFDYNYVKYINSGRLVKNFQYLVNAEKAYPDNPMLYDDFLFHYAMTDDQVNRKKYAEKLYKSNAISAGVLEYNYNVMQSLSHNAILITNGDIDTYPVYIWQDVKNLRKDITIVNYDMLREPSYRENLASKLQFKKSENPLEIIKSIIQLNPSQSIYLGHTVSKDLLETYSANLFLTGLTYKYSKENIDNVIELVNNYENNFELTELKRSNTSSTSKNLNANYLLPFITILEYYHSQEKNKNARELKKIILKIAHEANIQGQIVDYLNEKGL